MHELILPRVGSAVGLAVGAFVGEAVSSHLTPTYGGVHRQLYIMCVAFVTLTHLPFLQILAQVVYDDRSSLAIALFIDTVMALNEFIADCKSASGAAGPVKFSCCVICEFKLAHCCTFKSAVSEAYCAVEFTMSILVSAACTDAFNECEACVAVEDTVCRVSFKAFVFAILASRPVWTSIIDVFNPVSPAAFVEVELFTVAIKLMIS